MILFCRYLVYYHHTSERCVTVYISIPLGLLLIARVPCFLHAANKLTLSLICSLGGGELFDYCAEQDYLFENETVLFLRQILDGLQYMHSKNICHLDLKVKNEKHVKTTSTLKQIANFCRIRNSIQSHVNVCASGVVLHVEW